MNVAAITGRFTSQPELRKLENGISVCSAVIAVDSNYGKDEANFIDVVFWREKAEFVTKYFNKGSMIALSGEIKTKNYTDKNGSKQKSTSITADIISFCGSKMNSDNTSTATNNTVSVEFDDDDLPF